MIADNQTNHLYLADSLPKKYPVFYNQFKTKLIDNNIDFTLLPKTKDIWAVDYMPIQIDEDNFVQFVYNPNYLRDTIKWRNTISDVDLICKEINLTRNKSNIILDGGNVVRTTDKVIMCNKIFIENPSRKERDLIKELKTLFLVDDIIFIPTDSHDRFGHADGMVRFYNNNTVLINDYSKEDINFQLRFRLSLHNAGLNYIEIPYNPYGNNKSINANGSYINFLQMQCIIFIPIFDFEEDKAVIKQFKDLYQGQKIVLVNCNDIANDGGVLNCISWNILK